MVKYSGFFLGRKEWITLSPLLLLKGFYINSLRGLSEGILEVSVIYYYPTRPQLDCKTGLNLKKSSEQ